MMGSRSSSSRSSRGPRTKTSGSTAHSRKAVRVSSHATTQDLDAGLIAAELLEKIQTRTAKIKQRVVKREIEGTLRPLARAIARWATVPPTGNQTKTLLELLLEIEERLPGES